MIPTSRSLFQSDVAGLYRALTFPAELRYRVYKPSSSRSITHSYPTIAIVRRNTITFHVDGMVEEASFRPRPVLSVNHHSVNHHSSSRLTRQCYRCNSLQIDHASGSWGGCSLIRLRYSRHSSCSRSAAARWPAEMAARNRSANDWRTTLTRAARY